MDQTVPHEPVEGHHMQSPKPKFTSLILEYVIGSGLCGVEQGGVIVAEITAVALQLYSVY